MRTRRFTALALGAVATVALSACGGPSTTGTGSGGSGGGAGQAADANGVHNPSDATGGTIRMANSVDWDSLNPADMYYAYEWNFVRLYGRSLVMFKSAPGPEGATLVPGLAESLGKANADSTQWTYTLRQGVKFEDDTPVTSKDIKYAVERSLDKTTFPDGPTYFNDFLDVQGYSSPYQDSSPDKLGLTAIDTPDDRTIVFKLSKPFSGFDYFARWGADWPDGFGFLSQIDDSRVIRATGGNSNLSVRDPEVDTLLDKAVTTADNAARQKAWVDVDRKVMDDAYILPGIWAKGLLYRPPNLTNVYITNGFQMYDYLAMGTTRK